MSEELQDILEQYRAMKEQRDELLAALQIAVDALSGGLWDYGPGQDEHEKCNEVIAHCRSALAKATGEPPCAA